MRSISQNLTDELQAKMLKNFVLTHTPFVQVVCFKITRLNEIKVNRNYV